MKKHTLFMLTPWHEENGSGPYYCPDCGIIEGFLHYSPHIRDMIEIIAVDYPRPRNEIVELLGLEHQDSPVLVLADDVVKHTGIIQSMSTGRKFINDPIEICNFLAATQNGILPHP